MVRYILCYRLTNYKLSHTTQSTTFLSLELKSAREKLEKALLRTQSLQNATIALKSEKDGLQTRFDMLVEDFAKQRARNEKKVKVHVEFQRRGRGGSECVLILVATQTDPVPDKRNERDKQARKAFTAMWLLFEEVISNKNEQEKHGDISEKVPFLSLHDTIISNI